MPASRSRCGWCGRDTAVTPTGRLWAHGAPRCPGQGEPARRGPYWGDRWYGRHVTTLPDIGDWQAAAA